MMTATVPMAPFPGTIEVSVKDSAQLDQALNDGIAGVMAAATLHHTGVLVIRTAPGRYVVRAHPEVPYGLTQQQYQ